MDSSFATKDRDLHLSDADFERISEKVYKMTGIVLQDHKRQMIFARLSKRLRELQIATFRNYLDFIDSPSGASEVENFTNSVTTNITGFFREKHHFEHLAASLGSRDKGSPDKQIRIWSAGCSSGQEPYSVAMTILAQDMHYQNQLRILATDLDTSVLRKAKAGVYSEKQVKDVEGKYKGFFEKKGDEFEVSDALKKCISFKRLNVFENWPFNWKFDHIFCRNILIYFDVEHKNQVVSRLTEHLNVGGFLYLGHSESLFDGGDRLRPCGQTIYEKIS